MKKKSWVLFFLILLGVGAYLSSTLIERKKIQSEIEQLPHELQILPIPLESIEKVEFSNECWIIEGEIRRNRDSSSKIRAYYQNPQFADWNVSVTVSNHPIDDGYYQIVFRKK